MRKIAASLLLVCIVAARCPAQTIGAKEKPPLPDGPLLRQAADFSTWQIAFSYGNDKKTGSGNASATPAPAIQRNTVSLAPPRVLVVTRTNPLWHAVVQGVDGRKSESWSDGKHQILSSDGLPAPLPMLVGPDQKPLLPDYGKIGFPDMEWVSAATYTGVESVGGHDALAFQKGNMTVYVASDSRYPIYWKQGEESRTFTMLAPPSEKIVLPQAVAKVAQRLDQDAVRARRLPPP